mgnify:FL=1
MPSPVLTLVIPLVLAAATLAAAAQDGHLPAPSTASVDTAQPADTSAAAKSSWLDPGGHWRLMASPYTAHYHKNDTGEHELVYMFGLERQRVDGWVWGGVYFSNSFGQSSGYFYVGEKVIGFSPLDKLFFQWTAGIMYGYKEPYEDKVPFNVNGFSPGVTVGLGWQFTREFSMQAITLGGAGLMLQFAYDLR